MVPWLSLLLGSSIGAGANAYLTLAALGFYARFGEAAPGIQEVIEPFGSYWVIGPATFLFLVEFIADKIPAVDNLWDALHTLIRPVAAIFIALTLAEDFDSVWQIMAAMGSGSIALGTHSFKAGIRGLARLNPEPATNALSSSGLSLAEDFSVAGLMVLVFLFPALALVVIGALLVIMLFIGPRLFRVAVFAIRAACSRLVSPFYSRSFSSLKKDAPSFLSAAPGDKGSEIEWWCRAYFKGSGRFDYREGYIAATEDSLLKTYGKKKLRNLEIIPSDSIKTVSYKRGPLVLKIFIDYADSSMTILLFAGEKRVLESLLNQVEKMGIDVNRPGVQRDYEECSELSA